MIPLTTNCTGDDNNGDDDGSGGGLHDANMGASIIRIRLWGPLYYKHNKEPPKIVYVIT